MNTFTTRENWIRVPFSIEENTLPDGFSAKEKEELIELSCDGGLKLKFSKVQLNDYLLR